MSTTQTPVESPVVAEPPRQPVVESRRTRRRRRLRALGVVGYLLIRQFIVSWFFIKPFYMNFNGKPALRERKGELPRGNYWDLVALKRLYYRRVWAQEDEEPRAQRLIARHKELIEKIEADVAARCPAVTEEIPLPEYDWRKGSPEEFYDRYVRTPMPVVLREFALQTEAARRWNFEYVVEKCGDVEVNLTGPESDWMGPLKQVRDPKIYCANADAPFRAFPELIEELSIPKLQPYLRRDYRFSQFFVGQKATGSGLHCAGIWNFFYMIEGQKKWWFVDPENTWMVYPSVNVGVLAFAALVSMPDKCDLNTYKLFKHCPRYSVVLNPGDVLLNPPWWWHAVDNLTPTSLAVATRWDAARSDPSFYELNRVLSLLAVFNPSFPRFLYDFLNSPEQKHLGGLLTQGAGTFDEDVRFGKAARAKNHEGRSKNIYQGRIVEKIRARAKW
ncbi:MAG: cupin-like domain-containing protein [Planctomycetaceae bacterium]|nr:cupin-like domain-containing protein [Planctomycetaceae bacterium]